MLFRYLGPGIIFMTMCVYYFRIFLVILNGKFTICAMFSYLTTCCCWRLLIVLTPYRASLIRLILCCKPQTKHPVSPTQESVFTSFDEKEQQKMKIKKTRKIKKSLSPLIALRSCKFVKQISEEESRILPVREHHATKACNEHGCTPVYTQPWKYTEMSG
jgi:hypothetical protein